MSNTSKEMSGSISSDAIDAVAEGINRVGILDSEVQICANCGKEGSDVTNTCNKCKMVKYCNAACKKKHRHKHKKDCEEHLKRAAEREAELHDEKLFKEPPPPDDCPICFLRLPYLESGSTHMNCCGKVICGGCVHAFQSRIAKRKDNKCPFCRAPTPKSDEEINKRLVKRMELNDAEAIYNMACYYFNGVYGLPLNHAKALELWHRAAELGHADAYDRIGNAYEHGLGVEVDLKKARHYFELSAMEGDPHARNALGLMEARAGNMDRALKHYAIAARGGEFNSIKNIKVMYVEGDATKDDYAKALRSYQAYLDEIKSNQRDEAAAFNARYKYYGCLED